MKNLISAIVLKIALFSPWAQAQDVFYMTSEEKQRGEELEECVGNLLKKNYPGIDFYELEVEKIAGGHAFTFGKEERIFGVATAIYSDLKADESYECYFRGTYLNQVVAIIVMPRKNVPFILPLLVRTQKTIEENRKVLPIIVPAPKREYNYFTPTDPIVLELEEMMKRAYYDNTSLDYCDPEFPLKVLKEYKERSPFINRWKKKTKDAPSKKK